jgi:hypothetical protein
VAGHSPGTGTVGVFLFGLVNERIGDNTPIELAKFLANGCGMFQTELHVTGIDVR